MSFIASSTVPTSIEAVIQNYPFFPQLNLSDFRAAMRVDAVATTERAQHALLTALLEVNTRLRLWVAKQQAAGINTLAAVPEKPCHPAGTNNNLYLQAVYCLAKAQLVERYRDYDSTKNGHDKADELEPVADDYRRDAAWAINDLIGAPRTTVELI